VATSPATTVGAPVAKQADAAAPEPPAHEQAAQKKPARKRAARATAPAQEVAVPVEEAAETPVEAPEAEQLPVKKPRVKRAPAKKTAAKKATTKSAVEQDAVEQDTTGQDVAEKRVPKKSAAKGGTKRGGKKKDAAVAEEAVAVGPLDSGLQDSETQDIETRPAAAGEPADEGSQPTELTLDVEAAVESSTADPVVFDPFAIPEDLTLTFSSGASDDEDAPEAGTRRRRRRRRGAEDMEIEGGTETDPPGTITRVRAPRGASADKPVDHVVSIKGSTRLEAKRQRRRESRESGRRRHGITEAEFLARRESVDRKMVVRQTEERIQIGVLEDGVLAEHFVSNTTQDSMIGNVYVGKVQNVLPSMEAAFVDIGRGRNAVLYAGEVDWDAAKLDGKPRRIENALKSGDTVLVQVTKDPVGHKGARLTSQVSLPGRYLVYVPGGSMTGISRKLPDVERNRLKKILKEHLPDKAGVIVRTAAEGASELELMNDINRLRVQWEGILAASTSTKTRAPEMLYAEPDLMIKVVRDVFNEDFSRLVVQGGKAWDTIEAYVTYVAPDLVDRLERWSNEVDVFAELRIDEQIRKALERKVNLPSGGSLVIDRTEAMTVIDVNTGKFTGSGGNLEETVTKNNLEAAEEIVRQMRLRDMGGIIVVDFIDMVMESNRDLVLRRLVECLGRDRTKHQVAEVTSLGLVQMTRKKIGTGLLEVFSEPCEHCDGRGVVTHDEPVIGRARPQHVHTPGDRPTRAERRNSRRAEEQAHAEPVKSPAPEPTPEERERAQRARAALATIAAASGHAGEVIHDEHDDEAAAPAAPVAEEPAAEPSAVEDDKPRRRRRRGRRGRGGRSGAEGAAEQENPDEDDDAAQPRPEVEAEDDIETPEVPLAASKVPARADEPAAQADPAASGTDTRRATSRRRPRRAASSEQGSATTRADAVSEANGSVIVAGPSDAPRVNTPANGEPLMLGVGVPASEL